MNGPTGDKNGTTGAAELRPPVRHSDPPPWYEIGEYPFEDLCCDVHGLSSEIRIARPYGVRGNDQRGIDILADRADGKREAAQCKCYRKFTKRILDAAVTEFKDNLDHWRKLGVVVFRVYSASAVRTTSVLDAVHEHQEEFRRLGLEFEFWDGHQLSRILAPHRSIVSKYLDSLWADIICGSLQPTAPGDVHRLRGLEIQLDAGATALGELADSLSSHVATRIDEIRERYRRGHRRAARAELQRVMDDASWSLLSSELRSRVLRLTAMYTANLDGDTRAAREIAARADPAVQDSLSRLLAALFRLRDQHEIPGQAAGATPELIHLRAAALLEFGRPDEAVEALTSAPVSDPADAETHRLLALAYLAVGNVALARDAADAAARSNPSWLSVREANAIIMFWEGAGAAAGLPIGRYLPAPFPPELLRADDAAVRRITTAADLFDRLAEEVDDPDDQRRLRFWQFVCLVNSPLRERTLQLLRVLLEEDPASPIILAWALTRRLPIDRDEALRALSAAGRERPDHLDRVGIRLGLLVESGQAGAALQLLEESSEQILQGGRSDEFAYWRIQTLLALDRHAEATSVLESVTDDSARRRLGLQMKRADAAATGDSAPLIAALDDEYQRSGGMDLLIEILERQLRAGDADAAESRAEELLRGAPTPSAIRLVARAHWQARRPRACIELLDSHASAFPRQELPEDLRRLRVHCQRRLGNLIDAIEDARSIAQVENTAEAWFDLLEAQIDHGGLAGMEDTARRILASGDATQPELLRAAGVVALGNSALAKQLWKRAITQGQLADALVLVAYSLGSQLGVDDSEMILLVQRIGELGNSGSPLVRMMSIQDVLEVMRTSRQEAEGIHAKYARGEIPLHILPESHRPFVIEAFSTAHPARVGPLDPFCEPPIFARYGGWPVRDTVPLRGTLILDITSLVLAASLGVLARLVQAFDSVLVPRSTQRLLLSEISRLRPQQPLRSAATLHVFQRIRSGGVTVEPDPVPWTADAVTRARMGALWIAQIERIRELDGLSVDFLPLTAHDGKAEPPVVPENLLASITSPLAVAWALSAGGALSEAEFTERVARLGNSAGASDGVPNPRKGQKLFLSSVIAELLSQADLLSACCDYFSVWMFEEDRRSIETKAQSDELRSDLATWGQALVRDISLGVESGDLALIAPVEGQDESPANENVATECLLDLLRADAQGGLVCCDDRFVNRHPLMGQRPMASIPDLIATLRRAGRLTRKEYLDCVHRLRRANYRFLPLSSEEIVKRLREARTREGRVEESDELATLRTWWAGCCLAHATVQKAWEQTDGSIEAAFLLNSRRAITDAMHAVWSDTRAGLRTRTARSRWILDALFVGLVESQHHMPEDRNNHNARAPALAGADIAFLCSAALSLSWRRRRKGTAKSPGEEYLDWLIEDSIGSSIAADRNLAETAATTLRDLIVSVLGDESEHTRRAVVLAVFGRFLQKLPEALRDILANDPTMTTLFGFRSYSAVEVAGYSFESEDFWEACSGAINGVRSQVRPLKGGYYLFLRRDDTGEGPLALELVRADASIAGRIVDPLLGVLSEHRAQVRAALERSPHWTDGDRRSHDQIAGEVERLGAVQRVELVHALAGRSAADHYHRLKADFRANHRLSIDQVAPWDRTSVVRYFRLADVEASAPFEVAWSSACAVLVDELGLPSALDRILCVPSRVPGFVIAQFDALADSDAKTLLREKCDLGCCPISLLNAMQIAARSRHDVMWRQQLAAEIAARLITVDFRLDLELTRTIASRFSTRAAASAAYEETRSDIRLAVVWAHAARVVNIVRQTAAPSDRVVAWIRAQSSEAAGLFRLDRAERADFWGPHRIAAPHLLFDGLATAIQGNDFTQFFTPLDDLRALLRRFPSEGESWMLPILGDPSLRTDILQSEMNQSRSRVPLIFGDDAARFTSDRLEAQTESALAALEADPTLPAPWLELAAVVGDLPIYRKLRQRLLGVVDQLPLVAMRRENWTPLRLALPILAAATCADGTEPAVRRFVDRVAELLPTFSSTVIDIDHRRLLEQAIEAVFSACMALPTEAERRRVFFASLSRLLRISRSLCDVMAGGVLTLRESLPSDLRGDFAEVLFAWRARGSDPSTGRPSGGRRRSRFATPPPGG